MCRRGLRLPQLRGDCLYGQVWCFCTNATTWWRRKESFSARSNVQTRKKSFFLPAVFKQETLNQLHQEHGHQGIGWTAELAQQHCYWPGMFSNIKKWIHKCECCQVAKDSGHGPHGFMGHLLASRPNEMTMDFTLLEPSRNGFENVLTMTDMFSKITVAVPTWDQRAPTMTQALFRVVLQVWCSESF